MNPHFEPIRRLHHFAWRCRDAEQTRAFYEDILGLPLTHVIREEEVPSTGEPCPFVHLFFGLRDGSSIAFFDLGDGQAALPSPNTPSWVNHLALKVDSLDALLRAKGDLQRAGIEVLGITDHGAMRSIYFFDPNGIRLELTADVQEVSERETLSARTLLNAWTAEKARRGAASEQAQT